MRLGMVAGAAQASEYPLLRRKHSQIDALFSEVPPSASGIQWVHENAMSESHFLPEALGPGCAFLDYDNDGWMDIYLVNSGPAISASRPSRFATRSTRTIATARSPT